MKILTERQCVEFGGHCYQSTGQVLTSNPPQFPEVCKHCNKRRIGVQQEPMRYYEP